ncbi:MAG: CbbQ/NirQ/NorQ/GpvN family protein [Hahellaceae bacterium]|nr:CbbQ/NirQ/NorQ/GpvN family protein [Hahellaceae bacterium]MCP5212575.1 CbbQ/NirQ/NorQ/GpvN family protein [Hahellaceae bacterium]
MSKKEGQKFYQPQFNEVEIFQHAFEEQLPVLIKGPTGCGKTRFIEHMAERLNVPLYTVACHDDLTASDLVGRYLIKGDGTFWQDGPLTRAVREGGICYLDEVVEARKDTTVVLHPLADDRRVLPLEKTGEIIEAAPGFMLVVSYNPGYQALLKGMKPSTRQRFVAMRFDYPDAKTEAEIVAHESGLDKQKCVQLVSLAQSIRNLKDHDLEESASTRLLIYAAKLMRRGLHPYQACRAALAETLTDDDRAVEALLHVVSAFFEAE